MGTMNTGIKLGKYSIEIYLKKLQQTFLSPPKKEGVRGEKSLFILLLEGKTLRYVGKYILS